MSYYVESDGDRVPKDVYICFDGHRVLTMECVNGEDSMFKLARRIASMLNGSDAGFESVATKDLRKKTN